MLVILKKTYIRNGVVYIQHDRVYRILHITKLFLDFDFGGHFWDEEHNDSCNQVIKSK